MWQPEQVDDARQLNTGSAIWTRQKSELSEEDYTQFYHQIGAGYDTPFMTLHNKTEGTLNYTSLLFIPSQRPMDMFNPDENHACSFTSTRSLSLKNVKILCRLGFGLCEV